MAKKIKKYSITIYNKLFSLHYNIKNMNIKKR